MKVIKSFQCAYCTKIYVWKDSCLSHERRCYFNPKTSSCASCRFLQFKDYEYATGHHMAIRTCLRNHNVTKRMKTRCPDYQDKKIKIDKSLLSEIQKNYDPKAFLQPILDIMIAEHEEDLRKQKELDEQLVTLEVEALMGLLGSAVGYTILLMQEIDLTPEDTSDDEALERHYEFRQYQIDIAISRFQSLGFSKERINQIIMELAGKFPKQLMLYAPLCRQGEIAYNQKMIEIARLYEDPDSELYHTDIVEQLSSVTTTGLIGQYLFSSQEPFAINTPDLNGFSVYLNIVEKCYPDLKQEIIEGLKNPVYVELSFESPF